MTKIKIGLPERPDNDPLVIVYSDKNKVSIDYENTPGHGISMELDDLPRFVDALMFLHANERRAS